MEWYEVAAVVISVMAAIGSLVNAYYYVKRKQETNGSSMRGMYQVIRAIISLLRGPKPRERHYDYMPPDDGDDSPAAQFSIRYMDERGQRTQRAITLHKFGATDRKFVAHCHLRNATRDFLFSRVIEVIDLGTGEVLPKAEFFRRVKRM